MKKIESLHNDQVKNWRKLKLSKERKKQQRYLVEGFHLVEEAMKFKADILQLLGVSEEILQGYEGNFEKILITSNIAKEISSTQSNQGIFAIINIPENPQVDYSKGRRFLLLDQLQDPGNIGTIIRTADAAGFDAVILAENTVDIFNDKVIRSAQGSHWHIPIVTEDAMKFIHKVKAFGVKVIATALNPSSISYRKIDCSQSMVLIIGNEGQGVRQEIIDASDQVVHIPMPGQSESLNASIAAGVLMFHVIES